MCSALSGPHGAAGNCAARSTLSMSICQCLFVSVYLVTKSNNVALVSIWFEFLHTFDSLIMNADSMQVVPTKQQQRASEQQIANTSQSGNVIAFPQTPVP